MADLALVRRFRTAKLGLTLTAEKLVRRLLALVPPARQHLTAFHGVYAPAASLRAHVMLVPEEAQPTPAHAQAPAPEKGESPCPRPPRLDWATLQARTFGVDALRCACGGQLKVHSVVTSPRTAEEVLRNLGLWQPRLLLPPPRGPPQLELVGT